MIVENFVCFLLEPIQFRFQSEFDPISKRFRSDFDPISIRFRSDFDAIPIRFQDEFFFLIFLIICIFFKYIFFFSVTDWLFYSKKFVPSFYLTLLKFFWYFSNCLQGNCALFSLVLLWSILCVCCGVCFLYLKSFGGRGEKRGREGDRENSV